MNHDAILRLHKRLVPDFFVDAIHTQHHPSIDSQHMKERELAGSQFDFLLIDRYRVGCIINHYVFDMYFVRIAQNGVELVHSSKLRLDPCDQLERVEWFGYIVVSADAEA